MSGLGVGQGRKCAHTPSGMLGTLLGGCPHSGVQTEGRSWSRDEGQSRACSTSPSWRLHCPLPTGALEGPLGLAGLRAGLAHSWPKTQVLFLASFLLTILFLYPEFSAGQAPSSSHTSRQASRGLLASKPPFFSIVRLLPPTWGSAQGSDGGHSYSQEWDDCREGSPRGQRESGRNQQPCFSICLGELITGQLPTAQVSAWDQTPCTPGQAIQPLLGTGGIHWGCGEGTRGETLPISSVQGP